MDQLAWEYGNQGKLIEAEPLRECLEIREAAMADSWLRFNTMSLLGGALLGQGRYAEAEPLVVAGYEGMESRGTTIPTGWEGPRPRGGGGGAP